MNDADQKLVARVARSVLGKFWQRERVSEIPPSDGQLPVWNEASQKWEYQALLGGSAVFGAPALTLGTTNAAGTTSTVIASDSTILAFDGTNPAATGTAAPGNAAVAARRDHVHLDPVVAHAIASDPHTGYRLESADHTHATTGLQAGQVAHSALSGIGATDHHSNANDHAAAHGSAQHTGNVGTWKSTYIDAAGDEIEVSLGDDATVWTSTGAAGIPAWQTGDVGHIHTSTSVSTHSTAHVAAELPASVKTHTITAWFDPTSASTTVAKIIVGPLPFAGTFVKATAKCKEGETCGATSQIANVHLQTAANENTDTHATIFSALPTITNTNKAGSSVGFTAPGTFAKGDYLYIYSDQLGTGLTALLLGIEVTVT